MKKILLILIIGLFLYSCEKEEDQPKIYTSLGEMLKDIDEECAYQIYLKDSVDLKMWIDTLNNVSNELNKYLIALHETNHIINARCSGITSKIWFNTTGSIYGNGVSYNFNPNYKFILFSCGNELNTNINLESKINNVGIIDEQLPKENLPKFTNYDIYVTNNPPFISILEEWNGYMLQDRFFLNYNIKYKKSSNLVDKLDGQSICFMLYIQCYLKSSRLNYTESYNQIKSNPNLIDLIQFIWSKNEEIFTNSFDVIDFNKFYFEHIYSDKFLQELDSLGIQHQDMKDWKNTYLSKKYSYDI